MSAPLIVAIDAATTTGICTGRPGETPRFETAVFGDSGDNDFMVAARCLRWIAYRLTDEPPQQIWIEEPMSFEAAEGKGTNRASLVRLNGIYMILGGAARLKGISVHPVRISTARKGFLGHGRLKRYEAKKRSRAMCRLLGWQPKNDDEADAGCLWWFACLANDKRLTPLISKLDHKRIVEVVPFPRRASA